MAEKQSYEDKKLEAFRESLGEIDEIALTSLSKHSLLTFWFCRWTNLNIWKRRISDFIRRRIF
jgi:hypothetical protein